MDEPDMEFEEALKKIRSMEVRGAGRIARFAASTIKGETEGSMANSIPELDADLKKVFKGLHETRPTAVSLRNALRSVFNGSLGKTGDGPKDVNEMKALVISSCDDFISRSENATAKIGEFGADLIKDGFTIQTHCNSHNALAVIFTAFDQGSNIKVFATESRPWLQGHITVKELAEKKVPVTLIVDSAVRYFMDKVDIVLVGADTITAEGDLINKIGTAQIALAARDAGVPFAVCAETIKFSPESLYNPDHRIKIEERDPAEVASDPAEFPGVNIANPVFDITPGAHIDSIITDAGIIRPEDVKEFIKRNFGENDDLEFLN